MKNNSHNISEFINKVINNLKIYIDSFTKNGSIDDNEFALAKKDMYNFKRLSKNEFMEGISKLGQKEKDYINDSFAIRVHPKNKNFKMMVLAEGEGKVKNKESITTSKFVTNKVIDYFSKLDSDDLLNITESRFKEYFKRMNNYLKKSEKYSCKVITALVGPEYTMVINIGDLSCYVSKGLELYQLNEEDSEVWDNYRKGYFNKEQIRFRKDRYHKVKKMGIDDECLITTYLIKNSSYDKLFLFSRGVVDCITEDKLAIINSSYSVDQLAKKIINITTDGTTDQLYDSNNYDENIHGLRPATACVLIKKMDKK